MKFIIFDILSYDFFDYKDVYSLRKFLTFQGKILPKRLNKVTSKQQRFISKSIKRSRTLGLLPFRNKDI